jgi:hypothetical protein
MAKCTRRPVPTQFGCAGLFTVSVQCCFKTYESSSSHSFRRREQVAADQKRPDLGAHGGFGHLRGHLDCRWSHDALSLYRPGPASCFLAPPRVTARDNPPDPLLWVRRSLPTVRSTARRRSTLTIWRPTRCCPRRARAKTFSRSTSTSRDAPARARTRRPIPRRIAPSPRAAKLRPKVRGHVA